MQKAIRQIGTPDFINGGNGGMKVKIRFWQSRITILSRCFYLSFCSVICIAGVSVAIKRE